ncbi:MAG: DUF4838 domain-containing protein, partial [Clostridia bacterium]|nr:DUF4838 domain-containing protein [Clostridia bacterium]
YEMKWDGAHVKKLTIGGVDISEYTIVYEPGDKTISNAAEDLSKYIRRATDMEIPAMPATQHFAHEICVGKTDRDTQKVAYECKDLKNNGYAIVFDGGRLYLTGQTSTGAMYAVYSFLEDMVGWRFYSTKFEDVKYSKHIDIKADTCVTFSPKLINRDTFWYDTFNAAFAAKRKINGSINRKMDGRGEMISYAGQFVHSLPLLADTPKTPNVQPCLTDPAVYEKVLGNVRKLLRENPDAKIISVSQNDSYADGLGCQCENCKKIDDEEGTPMGSLLTFVNKIANDIKDEFPGVYVDTLAYRYTRKAPKNIKPADNVIIRLCSIECCFAHTLDSNCRSNKEFAADIEAWSKICSNLFIWDYTTDFLYYVNPFPNLKVLYDNVRFFVDHNVIGLFEQGNGQGFSGEFGELRAYLLSKVMWDPDMTREQYYECMDDFLQGYYGDGWQYIREYIDRVSDKPVNKHMGIYDALDKTVLFEGAKTKAQKQEKMNEYLELWQKAYDAADDEHKPNVEKSSLQVKYAELILKWDDDSSGKLKSLYDLMVKYHIGFYREGVRIPTDPDFTKPLSSW